MSGLGLLGIGGQLQSQLQSMGGAGGPPQDPNAPQGIFGFPDSDTTANTNQQTQQPQLGGMPGTSMPGMGGKGGMPGGTPFDGQGMIDSGTGSGPMPTMPPIGVQQGGTAGRPSPAFPFTPRGPGYNNPGGHGAQQLPLQQGSAPTPGILTNPQGQNNPFANFMQQLQQQRPIMAPQQQRPIMAPQPASVSAPQNRFNIRGAGLGGLMR